MSAGRSEKILVMVILAVVWVLIDKPTGYLKVLYRLVTKIVHPVSPASIRESWNIVNGCWIQCERFQITNIIIYQNLMTYLLYLIIVIKQDKILFIFFILFHTSLNSKSLQESNLFQTQKTFFYWLNWHKHDLLIFCRGMSNCANS